MKWPCLFHGWKTTNIDRKREDIPTSGKLVEAFRTIETEFQECVRCGKTRELKDITVTKRWYG